MEGERYKPKIPEQGKPFFSLAIALCNTTPWVVSPTNVENQTANSPPQARACGREKGKRIASIQVLRSIAATLVVVAHCGAYVSSVASHSAGLKEFLLGNVFNLGAGSIGVDLFFVISGFIIFTATLCQNNDAAPRMNFIRRRIYRIYPLWWVCLMLALCQLTVSIFALSYLDLISIAKSFLLYPEFSDSGKIRPLLIGQGWTLMYEMYFYSVFCIFITSGPFSKLIKVSLSIIALFTVCRFLPGESPWKQIISDPMVFQFCFGMLIAWFSFKCWRIRRRWIIYLLASVVTVLLSFVFLTETGLAEYKFYIYSLISVIAVWISANTVISNTAPLSKLAIFIGDASYSIYLSHTLVLVFFSKLWRGGIAFNHWGLDLYFLFILMSALIFGCIIYCLVEKPLLAYFRKQMKPNQNGDIGKEPVALSSVGPSD